MRSPRMRVTRPIAALTLFVTALLILFLALSYLLMAARAEAATPHGHGHHSAQGDDGGDTAVQDPDTEDPTTLPNDDRMPELQRQPGDAPSLPGQGPAQTITAAISGYSYQDNSPPGSATISMPVIHRVAGGTGSFLDPITTAVPGGASNPETPKGTKLYVAKLRRYFIVEDSGATKEGGKHFDLYVDGQGFSKADSNACMDSYTGSATIILNPPAGEPVTAGPLTGTGGCRVGGQTLTTGTNTGAHAATHAGTGHAKSTRPATANDGDNSDDN